ncbi:MAG TPA: polyphenol oxidase family protein, partial [Solirubrobacterales bacterium]|nr:polyphenol oxidase family protein [Solirubrobacterales bacterium]
MEWTETRGIPLLEVALPGARVAFSGRKGGVSAAPWDTLNLGLLTGDRPERVRENRHLLAGALDLDPARVAIGRQVHGAGLAAHVEPQAGAPYAEPGQVEPPAVDGHHTAEPDLALLVFVADCLPIAVTGSRGLAMLHGGWRGLAAGIVAAGCKEIDGSAAVIGPGIGPCCYEVGDEVLAAFASLGSEVASGRMLDLGGVAEALLVRAGVEVVARSELCTRCNPELLFSHRGQGPDTGRQAGL